MEEQKKQLYILAGVLAGMKLILHLVFNNGYGYFRDEFYYIECAKRLAWGYVDHPPLSMLISRISLELLGDSLRAIRFLPAVAGSALVFVSALIVMMLGGGRYAVLITGLGLIAAPVVLIIGNFLSMNIYDLLLIAVWFYYVIRLLKNENLRDWYCIGAVTGLALLNKYTLIFYLVFLLLILLAGKQRTLLRSKEFGFAVLIAALMLLPHLIWQIQNGFPTLEFMRNAALYKNADLSVSDFVSEVILEINPLNALLLLTSLILVITDTELRRYQPLLFGFIAVSVFFMIAGGRPYYLTGYLGGLLPLGAVLTERALKGVWKKTVLYIHPALLLIGGAVMLPIALPVLPPEGLVAYTKQLGIELTAQENAELGPLPQYHADMFGWEELTREVAKAYNSLTVEEKKRTVVFGQNYGEAGAVSVLGKKYGLPPAISSHNNYYLWGPGSQNLDIVIIIGGDENEKYFDSVVVSGVSDHPFAMPEERNRTIYIGRGFRYDITKVWGSLKNFN